MRNCNLKKFIYNIFESNNKEFFKYLYIAFKLRYLFYKDKVETCAIANVKSGKCSSDCKFCAQASIYNIPIRTYPLLDKETLYRQAKKAFSHGIDRFSFVASGIKLSKKDTVTLGKVIEQLKKENSSLKICASLGQISKQQFIFLKESGLDRYHHNLETSKYFYPFISTKQRWEDRYKTIILAKEAGLSVCSGGIFGIGETKEDIYFLIETLKKAEVDSIPINFLHPVKGTPLENAKNLTPLKCLKILIAFRIAIPKTQIRICGGRQLNLKQLQPLALFVADSIMVGDYLTTKGRDLIEDLNMINQLDFEVNLTI